MREFYDTMSHHWPGVEAVCRTSKVLLASYLLANHVSYTVILYEHQ